MDEPYIENPADLRDLNVNVKLLIQKFNHEHSNVVKDVANINSDIKLLKSDVDEVKSDFNAVKNNIKGMTLMLRILMSILSAIGVLIGIGVAVSN